MTKRQFNPYSASSNARHSLVSWFGQADKLRVSSKPGLNATLVTDKEAVLIGWHLVNSSFATIELNFYDQTTLPAAGDEIDWILRLAPESASTAEFALQIPFFRGLAFTITGYGGRELGGHSVEGVLLYA